MFFVKNLKQYSAYVPFNLLLKKYEPFKTDTELKIREALKLLCYKLVGLPTESQFKELDDTDKANVADVLTHIKFKQEELPGDIEKFFMEAYVITDHELQSITETLKKMSFQGSIYLATKAGKLSESETLGNFATQNISISNHRQLSADEIYLLQHLALTGNTSAIVFLFNKSTIKEKSNEIFNSIVNEIIEGALLNKDLSILIFFYNKALPGPTGQEIFITNLIDKTLHLIPKELNKSYLEFIWNNATSEQKHKMLGLAFNHNRTVTVTSAYVLLLEFFLENTTSEQKKEMLDFEILRKKIPEFFSVAADDKSLLVMNTLWNQAKPEQQQTIFHSALSKAILMAVEDENTELIDFLRENANPKQKEIIEQELEVARLRKVLMDDDDLSSQPKLRF